MLLAIAALIVFIFAVFLLTLMIGDMTVNRKYRRSAGEWFMDAVMILAMVATAFVGVHSLLAAIYPGLSCGFSL